MRSLILRVVELAEESAMVELLLLFPSSLGGLGNYLLGAAADVVATRSDCAARDFAPTGMRNNTGPVADGNSTGSKSTSAVFVLLHLTQGWKIGLVVVHLLHETRDPIGNSKAQS